VVPELASRNHVVQVMPVVDEALRRAGLKLADVDAVAVTTGPGLQGALLVGLQVAKTLAMARKLPLVGVNHLEGHLLAVQLTGSAPPPPYLGLVVSGGHTSLYHVLGDGRYQLLGSTRDDAAGEAYDKAARVLGLPYPGGIPIDQLAQQGNPKAVRFPRGLPGRDNIDFSFSGLKTAVLQYTKEHGVPAGAELADVCASFQEAVADALTKKFIAAARQAGVQNLVLCGGVAANSRLRQLALERAEERGLKLHVPPPRLCTDNGAMIAVAGYEALRRGQTSDLHLGANASWRL
jgi:N6-L-threonylcarbamoyladenine synthase